MMSIWKMLPGLVVACALAIAPQVMAQEKKTFSQEQLDQLLAPVALYPDALLAQVLMAATYPLEVVAADRWVKANPNLKDKALEDAAQEQSWDPAVKSLTAFPQVLQMMSDKLDWTQGLGDAFLAQQKDVMDTVQGLRAKAKQQGNLADTEQQKVITEQADNTTIIRIEPSNPQVVYVPVYNPTIIYGGWWWPSYPPYYWYPPGYVAVRPLGFVAGVAVGAALWGNCNWRGGDVNININRYNQYNRTNIQNTNWQHNVDHRKGVQYRDQKVAQQYNRGTAGNAQSREAFRGYADQGRQQIKSGDVPRDFGAKGAADRAGAGAGVSNRASAGAGVSNRAVPGSVSASPRDNYSGRSSGAFDGVGSGAQTRNYSNRGNSSMSSARSMGGGASRGGGGGGGAARGGGGRR